MRRGRKPGRKPSAYRLWKARHPERAAAHNAARAKRKAGKHGSPWYRRLMWIKSRCHCKSNTSYEDYGAKGVKCKLTVYDLARLWFRDKAYMMKKPECDRIDPNGNYEFSNCRYIEEKENLSRRNRYAPAEEVPAFVDEAPTFTGKEEAGREPGSEG